MDASYVILLHFGICFGVTSLLAIFRVFSHMWMEWHMTAV